MESLKELPIFCERCPTLAFAMLDGETLCERCLFEQLAARTAALTATPNVEPLQFAISPRATADSPQWT